MEKNPTIAELQEEISSLRSDLDRTRYMVETSKDAIISTDENGIACFFNTSAERMFTTKAKGIGLGLALSKQYVENHNGEIEVKSELGKGTTFIVRLPIMQGQ